MGYHVSILKTDKNRKIPIDFNELELLVSSFNGLKFENDVLCVDGVPFVWLDNGILWCKNPDESKIDLMVRFADRIGARVRGEYYETYRSGHSAYTHPDDIELIEAAKVASQSLRRSTKRKSIVLNAVIFGSFLLIVGMFKFLGWLN